MASSPVFLAHILKSNVYQKQLSLESQALWSNDTIPCEEKMPGWERYGRSDLLNLIEPAMLKQTIKMTKKMA